MNFKDSAYPLCRHTKTNGLRCQSPALATSAFCHFHAKLRHARRPTIGAGPGLSSGVLHPLRGAHSIQHAISMVLHGLATAQIHPKRAGKMLYALQMALATQ